MIVWDALYLANLASFSEETKEYRVWKEGTGLGASLASQPWEEEARLEALLTNRPRLVERVKCMARRGQTIPAAKVLLKASKAQRIRLKTILGYVRSLPAA